MTLREYGGPLRLIDCQNDLMASSASFLLPLAGAIVGSASSLAATAWSQRASRKRDDQRWHQQQIDRLRERRLELLVELAEYVEQAEDRLMHITDEHDVLPSYERLAVAHPLRLSARVKLLAPAAIQETWAAFAHADAQMSLDWEQGEVSHGLRGQPYFKHDGRTAIDVRRTLNALRDALRVAIDDPTVLE
jgi:hypothetical protein